jgi:hypothetical protein
MTTSVATIEREVVHVDDAHVRPMMGLENLEPLPSRYILMAGKPYGEVPIYNGPYVD